MQDSKENDLNFGKLLKKLEIDNIAIPELRQLKQEHSYLEKLKHQRVKVPLLPLRSKNSRPSTTTLNNSSPSMPRTATPRNNSSRNNTKPSSSSKANSRSRNAGRWP